MGVILGRWAFDGRQLANDCLADMQSQASRVAPDGFQFHLAKHVAIGYGKFRTTPESSNEPFVAASGSVVCFDGRLDNRSELQDRLTSPAPFRSDVALVGAAYDRWGTACFSYLVGDWALSIWNARDHSLLLAKDFVGTRHLYFLYDSFGVSWSTLIDALVALARRPLRLNEEYLAGCLSFFPTVEQAPFVGINAVAPATFVRIDANGKSVKRYWEFDGGKEIRYSKDVDYEEHFRDVFAKSVRRRVWSCAPVMAELSGGVDSSAIVCMADRLAKTESDLQPTLRTVSYYDESEPDWDERPYFTLVEEKRGMAGWHINAGDDGIFLREYQDHRIPSTPWTALKLLPMEDSFANCLQSSGCRVLLSGMGGDEILGGVPTPLPELADLLADARLLHFTAQSIGWALAQRTTVWHLVANTVRPFLPRAVSRFSPCLRVPDWIRPQFVRRNEEALTGYRPRLHVLGARPSFQENLIALDDIRRQLAARPLSPDPLFERRYPYLDRDLLEFAYAIPREQLLRPGQRRSLMRRALVGIVPDPVLNRRRKAIVTRRYRTAFLANSVASTNVLQEMLTDSIGAIDGGLFRKALDRSVHDSEAEVIPLLRALALEGWLRALVRADADAIVSSCPTGREHCVSRLRSGDLTNEFSQLRE